MKHWQSLDEIRRRAVYAMSHWNRIDYLIRDQAKIELPRFGGSSGSRVLLSSRDCESFTVHCYWIQLRDSGQLPANQIESVERVYIDGWSLDATARRIGCKPGTVKRYLSDAISSLSASLYERQPLPNSCPLCGGSIVIDYDGDNPMAKCLLCGRTLGQIRGEMIRLAKS